MKKEWTEAEFKRLSDEEKAAFPVILYCVHCGHGIPEANLLPLTGKRALAIAQTPIGGDVGRCRWHQGPRCYPVTKLYKTS